jgi:hypothetical protein
MSKVHIATIITISHFDKAMTMLESLRQYHDCHLHVLFTNCLFDPIEIPENENVTVYVPNDIYRPAIIAPTDYLRWALKPGFVHKLLEEHEFVTFCDCDLHFYSDPAEILDYGNNHSVTLSPHWRTIHTKSTDEIKYNFMHGLYNGGFFMATREGRGILEWWAERCCVECTASSEVTYVDQKYLDLVPLYFENVGIIKHKGCNVAAWNRNHLERTIQDDKVLVDGHEIIFIHYSPVTITWIEKGLDIQLTEHLDQYKNDLAIQRMALYRLDKRQFMSEQLDMSEVI